MSEQGVALVTGASAGIGAETARALAARGLLVYAAARRVEAMLPLTEAGVRLLRMDLTDDASILAGVNTIMTESGRVDVLVNNAGYGSYGPVELVPLDEARRQFEVNVFAIGRLIQLIVPHMRAQGGGRIINLSSIGGKIYEPLGAWYHATKFAVEGLSDSLRLELAPFGIDVVLIEPGPIASEWNSIARASMLDTSAGSPYADRAAGMAQTYVRADSSRQSSTPDIVAAAIVKAASAKSPRTRYPVGRRAGTILRARRLLPDRAMDAVITRALR